MAGRQVDELFWVLNARTTGLMTGVGAAQGRLQKFALFLKSPQGALLALGAAATLVGAKATGMAAEFDKALREVSTLIPKTVDEMDDMREAIVSLSTRVPEPPAQLTAGLYQVISAGVEGTADQMLVLEQSSKAAVAGLSDTKTAVDALTTVLNAYQLEASEAERVSDVFFKTVEQGKTTFPELASSIGTIATSAALAGVSIEEVGAALATMTKFGTDTQEAANSLNRFLLSVVQSTDDVQAAARRMGIEWDLNALQAKGLAGFMAELNDATEGQLEKLAELNPNIRSARSAFILAGDGLEEYLRIVGLTNEAVGSTETAFEKMSGALDVQFDILKNRLNAVWLDFGEKTLPLVIGALEVVNSLIGARGSEVGNFAQSFTGPQVEEAMRRVIATRRELQDDLAELEAGLEMGGFSGSEREILERRVAAIKAQLTTVGQSFTALLKRQEQLNTAAEANVQVLGEAELTLEQIEARAEARLALERATTQLTTTRVDDLRQEFEELREGIESAFGADVPPEVAAMLERLRAQLIELPPLVESLGEEVESLVDKGAELADVEDLSAEAAFRFRDSVLAVRAALAAQIAEVEVGTARHEDLEKLMKALEKVLNDVEDAYEDAEEKAEKLRKSQEKANRREWERTIRNATRLARAFVDLAEAGGLFNSETGRIVGSLVSIGEGIAGVLSGDALTGGTGIVAGLANLGSAVFGESPEEKAAREALEEAMLENARAIHALRNDLRVTAEVLSNVTGNLVRDVGIALTEAISASGRSSAVDPAAALEFQLNKLGVSLERAEELARELGISAIDSAEGMEQFRDALMELDLEGFFDSFSGKMELLRRELDFFDIDDPIKKLERLRAIFLDMASPLASAEGLFGGLFGEIQEQAIRELDLTTAEGREALQTFIEGIFRRFVSGELDISALGDLTPAQFLDALADLETALDGFDEDAVEEGVTEGFRVSRAITEVTGSLLVSLLTTIAVHTERTARGIEMFLNEALEGFDGIRPPDEPEGATGGKKKPFVFDPRIVFERVEVNVATPDPSAVPGDAARRFVADVDRRLRDRVIGTERALGAVRE